MMNKPEGDALRRAFAAVLRDYRLEKGWSQQQLSDHGISRGYVSELECGVSDPRLSTVFILARAFGTRSFLFVREVEKHLEESQYTRSRRDNKP